jgi:hypothetical protein
MANDPWSFICGDKKSIASTFAAGHCTSTEDGHAQLISRVTSMVVLKNPYYSSDDLVAMETIH